MQNVPENQDSKTAEGVKPSSCTVVGYTVLRLTSHFNAVVQQGLVDTNTMKLMEQTAIIVEQPVQFVPHPNVGIFYSGPARDIRNSMQGFLRRNWDHSKVMAEKRGAEHIEDVSKVVDVFLGKNAWFRFKTAFFATCERSSALYKIVDKPSTLLAEYFSRQYARRPFDHVVTAVCGADHERTFFKEEFPVLLQNEVVQTINNIPMQAVRAIAEQISLDEAFNVVCLSELRDSYAHSEYVGEDERDFMLSDYYERLLSYVLERKKTHDTVPLITIEDLGVRNQILSEYGIHF